eukprot:scaffold967_cov321-Pavlova_lutheri.AAC.9
MEARIGGVPPATRAQSVSVRVQVWFLSAVVLALRSILSAFFLASHLGSELTHDDVSRLDDLSAVDLHAAPFGFGIASVLGGSRSLLVGGLDVQEHPTRVRRGRWAGGGTHHACTAEAALESSTGVRHGVAKGGVCGGGVASDGHVYGLGPSPSWPHWKISDPHRGGPVETNPYERGPRRGRLKSGGAGPPTGQDLDKDREGIEMISIDREGIEMISIETGKELPWFETDREKGRKERRLEATVEKNGHVLGEEGGMERRWVGVDYPGPVNDIHKALETLGGKEEVLDAAQEALQEEGTQPSTSGRTLELRLRKDADRPLITGRIAKSSGMVLKVDWKEGREVQRAELVARLEHTYVFDGMADFQYQPPPKPRRTADYLMNEDDVTIESMIGETGQEELYLLPPFFAKVDQPLEYNFKEYYAPEHARVYPKEAGKAFKSPIQTVDYRVNVVPAAMAERSLSKDIPKQLVDTIKTMFDEKPVWSIGSIMERLKDFNAGTVRKVLAHNCYRFANGPWGKLWVRNGYDPRVDPQAGMYQALYYRLPLKWYSNKSKGSFDGSKSGLRGLQGVSSDPSMADVCSFKALPLTRGIFVQLIDLEDAEIQEILQNHLRREGLHCEESNGWFDRETMDRIRFVMYRRFCDVKGVDVVPPPREQELSDRVAPGPNHTDAGVFPGVHVSGAEEEEEYALLEEDSDPSSTEDDGDGSVSDGYPMDLGYDEDPHAMDPSEDAVL